MTDVPRIKIVVAEDDPLVMRGYQEAFEKAGFEVHAYFNGEDALKALGEMSEKPSIIMSDMMMPKMNGLELLENVRSNPELTAIPFMLVTSLGQEELATKGLGLGAVAYLIKGKDTLKELVEKVRSFSGASQNSVH